MTSKFDALNHPGLSAPLRIALSTYLSSIPDRPPAFALEKMLSIISDAARELCDSPESPDENDSTQSLALIMALETKSKDTTSDTALLRTSMWEAVETYLGHFCHDLSDYRYHFDLYKNYVAVQIMLDDFSTELLALLKMNKADPTSIKQLRLASAAGYLIAAERLIWAAIYVHAGAFSEANSTAQKAEETLAAIQGNLIRMAYIKTITDPKAMAELLGHLLHQTTAKSDTDGENA